MSATSGKALCKNEVVRAIAEEAGISQKQAAEALDALKFLVVNELRQKRTFILPGICRFSAKERKATNGKTIFSPLMKKNVVVPPKPAYVVVQAKALGGVKDAIQ